MTSRHLPLFDLAKPPDVLDMTPLRKAHCSDVHRVEDKCAFVQGHCDDVDAGLLSYLDLYFCRTNRGLTPVYWVFMLAWLFTLFASIGVSASDYLTLNLATISTKWRLSSTVAGVTLLALGNGSPDLFSTFLAMGSNSGSLAIGELIGAAGFITTVVAGATAIPRSFRVKKYDFMRDIICFAAAVSFSMFFLIDGHLAFWECVVMVLGYIGYVVLVVCWDVILKRVKKNQKQQARARGHFTVSDATDVPRDISPVAMGNFDGDTTTNTPRSERQALLGELPQDLDDDDEDGEEREQLIASLADIRNEMTVTHRHRRTFSRMASSGQPIRPSLLGAAEFGSVLSTLEKSRASRARSVSPQQRRHSTGPSKLLSAQRYSDQGASNLVPENRHQQAQLSSQGRSLGPPSRTGGGRLRAVSASAADGLSGSVPRESAIEGGLHPNFTSNAINVRQHPPNATSQDLSTEFSSRQGPRLQIPVPSINISDETGQTSATVTDNDTNMAFPRYTDDPGDVVASPVSLSSAQNHYFDPRKPKRQAFGGVLFWLRDTFLPQISPWRSKSWFDKILSIITIPIILGLTLTVPIGEVMIDQPDVAKAVTAFPEISKDNASAEAHNDFMSPLQSTNASPLRSPSSEFDNPLGDRDPTGEDDTWNPYLISLQIICAPQFCFFVITKVWAGLELSSVDTVIWCCSILGLSLLLLLALWMTNEPHKVPTWQPWLAFPGFVVAIAWISLIANEVVGVLKTFQLITGFSEAILGLLIFAAGNSVSDLFANLNTARAGRPVMAFHACFGGPMLNILTGIGVGGIYHIAKKIAKHDGSSIHAGTQFHIDVGRTLIVSGAGLLFTLLVLLVSVWRNQWTMTRQIGILLSSIWVVITVVNVILECLQLNGTIDPW